MHDEQDMRRMGGLRKFMPITAVTFLIGWLAIAGVPPFAGFWSKDEILPVACARAARRCGRSAWSPPLLTAYYMSRQVFLVFFGEARWNDRRRRATPTRRPPPDDVAPPRVAVDDDRAARGAGRASPSSAA